MKKIAIAERFERHYIPEPNSGCWLWTAQVNNEGYGRIDGRSGRRELAHRVSYELHIGPIPDGMCVLHKCDVRCCVNPDHLWPGTHLDNVRDMDIKGRCGRARISPNAKLTERQIQEIRNAPGTQREIAARYGISFQHVSSVKSGRVWKHLPEAGR